MGRSLVQNLIAPFKAASVFVLLVFTSSCVYRFSNLHLTPPANARTIAIEAIYDTSKAVVPHEYLWQNLQKQFAISGVLRLANQEQADLYLRTQIEEVEVNPGSSVRESVKDPNGFVDQSLGPATPFSLGAYPSYRKASSYAKEDILSVRIRVELWDLRQHKKLFQQKFSAQTSYPILNAGAAVEYGF